MAEETERFRRLVHVATQLNSTLNLDELLQLIMAAAAELVNAETSSLLLVDDETDELVFEVVAGGPVAELAKRRFPKGEGIAGWAVEHQEPVVVNDTSTDSRFYQDIGQSTGFQTRSLLAVPLVVKDRSIGVIEVVNKVGDEAFSDVDLDVAQALASFAAVAIDNASLYAKLAEAVITARLSYRL
jgi:GAF domain-containing protein